MAYQTILLTESDGVATITLNRPEKRNAMNPALHVEITHALDELANRGDVRVLVITGAGEAFCAGMDLKEYFVENKDRPHEMDRLRALSQEWRARKLRLFPAPTIAKVNGYCIGGGIAIVTACDIAIASESATFNLSEVNFGQIPAGPVARGLSEVVDQRDALYYMLTGEAFDGRRASEMRLVTRAVPADQLDDTVATLARDLASKNPIALRLTKQLYRHSEGADWDSALSYANAKVRELTVLTQGDWIEKGIPSFLRGEFRPGMGEIGEDDPEGGDAK